MEPFRIGVSPCFAFFYFVIMVLKLKDYLDLPSLDRSAYSHRHRSDTLLYTIAADEQKLNNLSDANYKVAILGVPEDRNSSNSGAGAAPDKIREKLYSLYLPAVDFKVVDLGNIKRGKNVKDTYAALSDVYGHLLSLNIIPLILGGTQDLTIPIFQVYHELKHPFNFTNIDARFDFGNTESGFDNRSFLSKIVQEGSPYLFNYTQLGYQSYYTAPQDIDLMDDLWFDCLRLGKAQADIRESEPYLRDSDFVSLDMRSIRQSDAPGVRPASVHGFFGQEACQLSKYAGMSDRLTGFGIYETNPTHDIQEQTVELSAQLAWHFMLGVWLRKRDFPARPIEEYRKFIVTTPETDNALIFYKNPKTGRWWVEVPYIEKKKERKIIIACSERDYETAAEGDIPQRWIRYYHKLSSASSRLK